MVSIPILPNRGGSASSNGKPHRGLVETLGIRGALGVRKHRRDSTWDTYQERGAELAERFLREAGDRPSFPLQVFPSLIRRYLLTNARSIHCPLDLVAVPLLAVAGAAIGRSGRRLKVKDGWITSSCLWTVGLTSSSGGKTPALKAIENFYEDRQAEEYRDWKDREEDHKKDPENNPKPGPYPALKLTDTTIESLRTDLMSGPVLFSRDELGAWSHQMGQYKSGNADRFDWNSFWSHLSVNIGRKSERVYVEEPFVSVTGMMVPASVRELNYRGQADDGFVHRMLLAYPEAMPPVATLEGVPDKLTNEYKRRMTRLFDPPKEANRVLTFEPKALRMILRWVNAEHFRELRFTVRPGEAVKDWLVSKYRKLYENCLRLCLVLHEVWRVAGEDHEPESWEGHPRDFYGTQIPFVEGVIDRLTVERAIAVVEYFKGHIGPVQDLLGEDSVDDVDRLYHRLRKMGDVTARQVIHRSSYKSRDRVLAIFAEWERRGHGSIGSTDKGGHPLFKFDREDA